MSVMLKPLFEILIGDVSVMDNVIYNYIIMLTVGEIAYHVAWNMVGELYHIGVIEGRLSGSIIHWSIRLIAYVLCAYVIRGCICVYEFVLIVPHWIWQCLLGICVAIIVTAIMLTIFRNRKVNE